MATITFKGLTNLQARVIFEKIEDGEWDKFNEYLKNNEVNEIDLQDTDQRFDENGDSDYTIEFSEAETDIESEDEDETNEIDFEDKYDEGSTIGNDTTGDE